MTQCEPHQIYNEAEDVWITIDPSRQCHHCAKVTANQPIKENIRICDNCCVYCAVQSTEVLQKMPFPLRLYFEDEAELAATRPQAPICETCLAQHEALVGKFPIAGRYTKQ